MDLDQKCCGNSESVAIMAGSVAGIRKVLRKTLKVLQFLKVLHI